VEEIKLQREKRLYARRMLGARKQMVMETLETIKKHNSVRAREREREGFCCVSSLDDEQVLEGPLAGFEPKRKTLEPKHKSEKPFTMMDMSE
jgi:hypothetical protein